MPVPAAPQRVQLLDADPDLGRHLDERRAAQAARALAVAVQTLPRGPWTVPPGDDEAPPGSFGLLLLDGLAVREMTVGEHPCADLIGPGDVIRLRRADDPDALLPRHVEWSVLLPTRVAVLGEELVASAAAWPEVLACLLDRANRRADRLVVLQAITHLTRVDDRLLALLWFLSERWGRVVPGGVVMTLRLPHRTLAGMVGARRPSVTTALGQLIARGDVERRADGALVLRDRDRDRDRDRGAAPTGAPRPVGVTGA